MCQRLELCFGLVEGVAYPFNNRLGCFIEKMQSVAV